MATRNSEEVCTAADVAAAGRDRVLAFWEGGFASFPLPAEGKAVIGRLKECEIRIDHPSVSRKHAELFVGESPRIVDLGSFNGTRVGGVRLAPNEATAVSFQTVIEIGSAYIVLERAASETTAGGAPPRPILGTSSGSSASDPIVLDERMKQLHRLLSAVAQGTISVLLLGETGVGKEVVARSIHRYSPRSAGPFVSINCAAIPEALLESELFGHERGAFTGAVKERAGLLEAAHGGTLFLDEIGEMPLPAQAKLLRAIELRQVVRVGGVKAKTVDVRFISATNRDLEGLIAARMFRKDLLFRLNGVSVTVPPLRERGAELEALAQRFLGELARSLGRPGLSITGDALLALRRHTWPGNIRELRNVIERAALICAGNEIRTEHLALPSLATPSSPTLGAPQVEAAPETYAPPPSEAATDPPPVPYDAEGGLPGELQALERQRILEALERCAGNQTRAAAMLGMSRRVLIHRLEAYGVPRPRK